VLDGRGLGPLGPPKSSTAAASTDAMDRMGAGKTYKNKIKISGYDAFIC